ncbi:Polysaccharide biosynthesis protein [Azotobacter vinelandii CA]|uniref:Polysaccharide biosynthesis protein n=2 Tax=Azotobacter vinelandii TaxID=354 RepID=C1DN07_AZOVD|nr:nucleoside-diphosphate sugar epimerase/dehydratase [Azotobacter vinelandii]ACO79174.1 Polysaccharide biosynthesis protein [Azotobacter vinelandii DJ]AGK14776.1 Polysaccharide biosynthesis protein [Azotobacter vinelandii CA]AGK21024.1 Polysaccharide biosynthesis protein [Azotobacter vinelandii CA6]SFY24599.1 NDP-sugar epimerase, includes UDP-GlcNAc-inverting 4,6-dehydratase FlaA1 and capsular polysaccharide biosynthesis protein EpsC [Azotobacter vinelandii]GLK61695.1 nucleotide sugar epimera
MKSPHKESSQPIRQRLLDLSHAQKRLIQVGVDLLLVWLALWLAFYIRLEDMTPIEPLGDHAWLFTAAPAVALPIFVRLGMYRAVMRYLGNEALLSIARAVTLSALLLALVILLHGKTSPPIPRSVIFNYWGLSLLSIGGLRIAMRQYFTGDWFNLRELSFRRPENGPPRVAIYGAGSAGNQLAHALLMGHALRPVAFIDDDAHLAGRTIAGLPVYAPDRLERMLGETGATEIVLAIPSASRSRRRRILEMLQAHPLPVRSMPSIAKLACGRLTVNDLQEVDIADLLGRDALPLRPELQERCIRGQVVMVTGAGGSIGAELCRQILANGPATLILFEHSEYNLYSIHGELERRIHREAPGLRLVPVLGSVRHGSRLLDTLRHWRVDTLYHAAAYKHVPLVEVNIGEGVLNNTFGTLRAAQAAIRAGVRSFVLISTDKAVRPTNVMGGSKRLAEMVLQAFSGEREVELFDEPGLSPQPNRTRFTMVRFGNVLGSSGSVIPLFREQIRNGGPITVTHPEITRYFMTIPEAAQLVIQAGAMGEGGDVFVLDMGEPVKILDLAEKMVRLSGLSLRTKTSPDGDIEIRFVGLRPGEKLYEELLIGDGATPTSHSRIMRAHEEHLPWRELKPRLEALAGALEADDFPRIRELLQRTVSGYRPSREILGRPLQEHPASCQPVPPGCTWWFHRMPGRTAKTPDGACPAVMAAASRPGLDKTLPRITDEATWRRLDLPCPRSADRSFLLAETLARQAETDPAATNILTGKERQNR